MPYPLVNIRDKVGLILIGGNICAGKDTAANHAAKYILEKKGINAGPRSMGACLMKAYGFNKTTPRERITQICSANPNEPWAAELVAKDVKAEPGSIVVVSGLRRQVDAEYFFDEFPYSHFIALFGDEPTLVDRIVKRNRAIDFPQDTSETQKYGIALQMLKEEERMFGIGAMFSYVCNVPCKAERKVKDGTATRGYVIDTGRQKGNTNLEFEVEKALMSFGIK